MTNSFSSSSPSSQPPARHNRFGWAIMLAALLGLADATYLTVSHYLGTGVECSVTHGCEQVLASDYATPFGIPVSLVGLLYYAFVFLAACYFGLTGNARFRHAYRAVIAVGTLVSAYLVYLQLGVIGAVCQYCMVSAALTALMATFVILEAALTKPTPANEA